jgi:hypothetical protein
MTDLPDHYARSETSYTKKSTIQPFVSVYISGTIEGNSSATKTIFGNNLPPNVSGLFNIKIQDVHLRTNAIGPQRFELYHIYSDGGPAPTKYYYIMATYEETLEIHPNFCEITSKLNPLVIEHLPRFGFRFYNDNDTKRTFTASWNLIIPSLSQSDLGGERQLFYVGI